MNTTTSSAITKKAQKENINSQRSKIFAHFEKFKAESFSSVEIDMELGMKNSEKRISELLRDGKIMIVGREKINKKTYNKYLYADEIHREQLIKAMFEQDFKAWVKQGEKFKELVAIQYKLGL
jgi:hypothetical protein